MIFRVLFILLTFRMYGLCSDKRRGVQTVYSLSCPFRTAWFQAAASAVSVICQFDFASPYVERETYSRGSSLTY